MLTEIYLAVGWHGFVSARRSPRQNKGPRQIYQFRTTASTNLGRRMFPGGTVDLE